jgi:hypothetical protein
MTELEEILFPLQNNVFNFLALQPVNYFSEVDIQYRQPCGIVVRVPGCTLRGPGFDSRRYQIF